MKNLLIQLNYIHDKLKDKNELAIAEKYNCVAKRYFVALAGKNILINLYIYNHISNLISKLSSTKKSILAFYNISYTSLFIVVSIKVLIIYTGCLIIFNKVEVWR